MSDPYPPAAAISLNTLQTLGLTGRVQLELQRQRLLASVWVRAVRSRLSWPPVVRPRQAAGVRVEQQQIGLGQQVGGKLLPSG